MKALAGAAGLVVSAGLKICGKSFFKPIENGKVDADVSGQAANIDFVSLFPSEVVGQTGGFSMTIVIKTAVGVDVTELGL